MCFPGAAKLAAYMIPHLIYDAQSDAIIGFYFNINIHSRPFYMVDKSRSRKEGGAGLGMTLCKEIIELHHARWIIESEEGKGTTITIYFPGKETGK